MTNRRVSHEENKRNGDRTFSAKSWPDWRIRDLSLKLNNQKTKDIVIACSIHTGLWTHDPISPETFRRFPVLLSDSQIWNPHYVYMYGVPNFVSVNIECVTQIKE
jgi:hypothetical protein